MNKITKTIIITISGLIIFAGCNKDTPKPNATTKCDKMGVNTPIWLCKPDTKGGIGSVGSAKKSSSGFNFQKTTALTKARDKLTSKMNNMIVEFVADFSKKIDIKDSVAISSVSKIISQQVVNQMISGSKQKALHQNPANGEIFIWVLLDKKVFKQALKEAIEIHFKNNDKLSQYFINKKAQNLLNALILKL